MQLTKNTFRLYAAKFYDNPYCLTEEEFESDVFKSSIIKKMLTAYSTNSSVNIHMVVNMTISYYNVFEHHAATYMLKMKLSEDQYELMNAILVFLSYPQIEGAGINTSFLITIRDIYK